MIATVVAWLLAQTPGDSWSWQQFGALGALAAALVAGQLLVLHFVVGPERGRGDRLEDELRDLNASTRTQIIPALVDVTRVVVEGHALVRDMAKELEEARVTMREMARKP